VIYFTKHAREKFAILEQHNFRVSKEEVVQAVNFPDIIDYSRYPLFIAQKKIDSTHVLRVVYKVVSKESVEQKVIITFYPGRTKQYED